MANSRGLVREIIDEGISTFPDMKHYGLRKALIVLTSPYLLYRSRNKDAQTPEYLDYTEMFITSYCNLKCKYCSASIPYYLNTYHIDLDFLLKQLNAYLDVIDGVETFRVIGGEPFLHPNLADILDHLVASDKIHTVHIVTNGTIVPRDERIRDILRNKKVWLDISNYGEVSDKVSELEELRDQGEIQMNIDEVNNWFWPNHKYNDLQLGEEETAKRYHSCPDYCHVLRDGKFFTCGEAFHIANIPDSPMKAGVDYVDLLHGGGSRKKKRQEVLDVAFKRKPSLSACNRCGGGSFLYKDRVLKAGEQPTPGEVFDFDLPADIPVVSTKMI